MSDTDAEIIECKRELARIRQEIAENELKLQQLAFWSEQVNEALYDYLLACEAQDAEALQRAYERAQLADRRWWQEANR